MKPVFCLIFFLPHQKHQLKRKGNARAKNLTREEKKRNNDDNFRQKMRTKILSVSFFVEIAGLFTLQDKKLNFMICCLKKRNNCLLFDTNENTGGYENYLDNL